MSAHYQSGGQNFICPMCAMPIDLNKDETADEGGKVMHAECYFKRVGGHERTPPADQHT
jgi:hypothetical protein